LAERHLSSAGRTLEERVNMSRVQIEKVMTYLGVENPAPVIKQGRLWQRTPVNYQLDHDKIARLSAQREAEWREIQEFVGTDECLMAFLRRALDDPETEPCGHCANCLGEAVVPESYDHQLGVQAAAFLRWSSPSNACTTLIT